MALPDTVTDVAGQFLLWRLQNGTLSDRPLVFIGHSFGGLVVEQAVVQANSAGGRYHHLVELIGGIILLGTPHQGSKSQRWGSVVANLANMIDYGETELMKEVDEKSMKIFDLISEFKKIMIGIDLAKTAVICFYENRPTNYVSRLMKVGPWIDKKTSSMVRTSCWNATSERRLMTARSLKRRRRCCPVFIPSSWIQTT